MNYNRIALFSDLDGTLFNDDTQVPESNKTAIQKFCNEGGIFCVSSGRIPANIIPYLEDVPVNGPCILYNGSAIYDWRHKLFLHKEHLNTTLVERFLDMVLSQFPQVDVQVYPGDEICFISPKETANAEFVRLHQPCRFESLESVEKPWLKVLMMGDPKTLAQIRILAERIPEIGDFVSTRSDYLEILPHGVSKGSSLKRAMEDPRMKNRIAVAVGDFYNDIELLQAADIGVAPSNALQEVKNQANFVGCSNNEGIVAYCINQLFPQLE